jgi:hypothetical protein
LAGKSPKESEAVQINVKELEKNNSKIYYESLDARNINSLNSLFSKIKKKYGKIDLIINGAGVVDISFIKDKTIGEAEYELSNKILPAINILKLSLKYNPQKIINFSSVISRYGSAGQSIYTMANEMVNGLTAKYECASVIHWPPWDGVGMTENQGILKKLRESGVSLLSPPKADELFSFDLASSDSKSIYYMDKDDDWLYGFSLKNFSEYEILIGKILNPSDISASNHIFEKNFNLSKDVYLKDHQIEGISYVPAAVGIGMFFCLGNMHDNKLPILENVIIHNPIIIKNKPLRCYLKAEKKNDNYDFSIKSNALHFSGRTKNSQGNKTMHYQLNNPENEILIDSIYSDYYSEGSLYLGPTFQSIDRAFLDKDENPFFRIDNAKLFPVLNCGFYDKLIQWIDVSFQVLGAIGLKNNCKFIPVKVSRITTFFHNNISNYLYAIPSVDKIDSENLEGSVIMINENEEVILEMKGISLKAINKYSEDKLKIVKYKGK